MTTRGHIALVEHQLRQLASGFALAKLLGRVLVLPPLVCGYDKYWGSLSADGMIPGGPAFAAPIYHCPLDHVLEPYALHLDTTGREWSFLANPRLGAAFNASRASTAIDAGHSRADALAEVARLRALRARVLEVTNLPQVDVLGSALLDGRMRVRLVETLGNAGGSWCCRPHKDDASMPNNYAFRLLSTEAVNKYTALSSVEATEGGMPALRDKEFLTGPL